jgi:hypothetical protein
MPQVPSPVPARVVCRACASFRPAAPQPRWQRALLTALLVLLLMLPAGCGRERPGAPAPLATSVPAAPLQEVAPPPGVQQLATALDSHSPQLRILAPADGATLPDGPWTLRLQVRDWPLTDAGELGLGGHVVVQLDDEPPQRLSQATANGELTLAMAPLRPGSHRLTAYTARPWGEAVKQPGAFSQIQLQRVAPTPLRVPAAGTPQLIAVSPGPQPAVEPVLLDWLLLDAPLQGLREGDASWRLRVSVNGDSFLVNQNSPLWLKGWRPGSNSLQLDLVDALGEPLNPPFNSLVAEVVIQAGAPRPIWLNQLEPTALARLLGEARAASQPPLAAAPLPIQPAAPEREPEQEPAEVQSEPASPAAPEPIPNPDSEPEPSQEQELEPEPELEVELEPGLEPGPTEPVQPLSQPAAAPAPLPLANPERIAPSTSLSGSAREQVRDDGKLIQPRGQGPLAGLRERFGS